MKARLIPAVILLSTLAACGTPPPGASLPPDPGAGLADPGRGAILNTAYAFATPSHLAQRPADAALAIAQAEYLAVDLDINQRWREFSPIVSQGFQQARPEWRTAAGIAPDAPPQAVIDALSSARYALLTGDATRAAAALPTALFTGGGSATLGRLSTLPALPRTADAARNAENELARMSMAPDE